MTNLLTVDTEDYFHVSAFENISPPESWVSRELRVERNTEHVLSLLDEGGVTATFFVLGWVAEHVPNLVKRIAKGGHEVASHGSWHRRVYTQKRSEFREDVRNSKTLLEDLVGRQVLGYRAPSFSISQTSLWAFDELLEAGYRYDSSVFPVRHDLYGIPFWPRFPFLIERLEGEGVGNWVPMEGSGGGDRSRAGIDGRAASRLTAHDPRLILHGSRHCLLEVPITTSRVLGKNFPIAGGGYFRLFPYALTRWGLNRINRVERQPFVFYIHPWELDPEQPRLDGAGLRSRFRHYVNLGKTEPRFRRLIRDFPFSSIKEILTPDGIQNNPGFRPTPNQQNLGMN